MDFTFELMTKRISVFILLYTVFTIGFISVSKAQNEYIVVEKTLSNKQVTYSSGDEITFRLKEENFYRTDHIIALNDTAIEFHYSMIPYKDISHINIKGKVFINLGFNSVGGKLQIAGIAIIAIDQLNQVLVRGEEASFNQGIWMIGGSLFLGGTILKWMHPRKLRLGGKYRIRYMNLNYL